MLKKVEAEVADRSEANERLQQRSMKLEKNLNEVTAELSAVRAQLASSSSSASSSSPSSSSAAETTALQTEVAKLRAELKERADSTEDLKCSLEELESQLVLSTKARRMLEDEISELQDALFRSEAVRVTFPTSGSLTAVLGESEESCLTISFVFAFFVFPFCGAHESQVAER